MVIETRSKIINFSYQHPNEQLII